MAFVLKSKETLDAIAAETRQFTHEPTGITMTLRTFADRGYQAAIAQLQAYGEAHQDEIATRPLDEHFFDNVDGNARTPNEMWVRAIGRFLIVDWDVLDGKDEPPHKPVKPSEDSMVLLVSQIDDPAELVTWCLNMATQIAADRAKDQTDVKKKPLTVTSGKKTMVQSTSKTAKQPIISE